jgi:N-acetylmuramic acid 6-phosphate (MurNAc-6-P) etherase
MHFLGVSRVEAEQALERSGGVIRRAVNRQPPPVPS